MMTCLIFAGFVQHSLVRNEPRLDNVRNHPFLQHTQQSAITHMSKAHICAAIAPQSRVRVHLEHLKEVGNIELGVNLLQLRTERAMPQPKVAQELPR